jgi:predicted nucleic acid-binding protein
VRCERSGTAGVPEAVVDASAVVDVLGRTPRSVGVIEALRGRTLHAPAHLDAEVLATLVRMERQGRLGDVDLDEAVVLLEGFAAERHPVGPLLRGAAARRANLWVADGLYVELAQQLGCELVTCDAGQATGLSDAVLIS